MPRPRFVELKNNYLVTETTPTFVVRAGTKLRVVTESPTTLTVQTLDRKTEFSVPAENVKPTEMLAINKVYFDREMKEHVLVTNGECVLSHKDGNEKFHEEHEGCQCIYAPSEGIAIRCIGTDVIHASDTLVPVCAWTYRAVNPDHLEECNITTEQFRKWLKACPTGRI